MSHRCLVLFLAFAAFPKTSAAGAASCAQALSGWCNDHTSKSPTDCFTLAANDCAWATAGYESCVLKTAQFCVDNTMMSELDCLKESATACKEPTPRLRAP